MIREKLIFKVLVDVTPVETCPTEALAFIAKHELDTGVSMGAIQKNAICVFVKELKLGSINGSDLWTLMSDKGTILHPLSPSTDSAASSAGFKVDLISATSIGTMNNFIAGNFTPDGLQGGTGKYFDLISTPNDFNQSLVGFYFFATTATTNGVTVPLGASDAGTTNRHLLRVDTSPDQVYAAVNSATYPSPSNTLSGVGLFGGQRNIGSVDNIFNGDILSTQVLSSVSTSSNSIYTMARSNNGVVANEFNGVCGGHVINAPVFTANQVEDFYAAWQNYQDNIITGGR